MLLVLPRPAAPKWFLGVDELWCATVLGEQKVSIRAWRGDARPGEGL